MRHALSLFLICLCSTTAWSVTLGETVTEMSRSVANLRAQTRGDTWGQRTLLADLDQLAQELKGLDQVLQSSNATELAAQQQRLESALRQVKTSNSMVGLGLDDVLAQGQAVTQRLRDLRLRFAGRAPTVWGSLSEEPLEEPAELSYRNPAHLLIEARCVHDTSRQLNNNTYFGRGYFFLGGPQNVDSLQLRELVLAAANLERRLSVRYDDVRQTMPAWERLRVAYRRLGYIRPSSATRQLERSMSRLEQFYASM